MTEDIHSIRTSAVVSLAALNNSGLICHHIGQYEECSSNLADLNCCITWIQQTEGNLGVKAVLLNEFQLNAMLLKAPSCALAA